MRKSRTATLCGAFAAATLLTVGNASAVEFESEQATSRSWDPSVPSAMTCQSNSVGKGCYREVGDWFEIVDHKKDGHSAVVVWRTVSTYNGQTNRQGAIYNNDGYQEYRYRNKNFSEIDNVEFRICAGDWPYRIVEGSCSSWKTTRA
ncbi:hypothetical protein [Streptomyces rubiginosohelvolus]|uniref:hypothetical protein n=1 Tax=Streptomyces rubiginosohelvolus TaxID=67362 RepID=UPI0037113C97